MTTDNDMAVGTKHRTNACGKLRVVRYESSRKVHVRFVRTGYTTVAKAGNIREGAVKDLLHPTVCEVGCIGVGTFQVRANGKVTLEYSLWQNMLKRCYNKKFQTRYPTYVGCSVVDEWLNFQTFAAWCQEQVGFGRKNWELDKDLLTHGNKIYGPDTCCFLPSSVNSVLAKCAGNRGEYLIGVHKHANGSFRAMCSDGRKQTHIGYYETERKAYRAYKRFKENLLAALAETFKAKLAAHVYSKLKEYEVDEND